MLEIGHFNKFCENQSTTKEVKILIVDDDLAVIKSIKSVLCLNGLSAHSVSGGSAAIEELQRHNYDIVLLDINMPDMDGTEVLDHINSKNIDTSVIIISGESELRKALHVLKNGAKDYIRKPYSVDELLFSINNVMEKITLEQKNLEILEKLEESEALHRFIVHNSPDLLYMLDRGGRFVFVNKNTLKLLGYSRKEIIGTHYQKLVHPEDVGRSNLFFESERFPKSTKNLELRLLCKDKASLLHVEIRAINIEKRLTGGYKLGRNNHRKQSLVGTYGVARDITERKKAEEIIRFQHNHDQLTGLPNRTLLNQRLKSIILHSEENNEFFAVLFIDINRFKLINDTYGQSIGDALLQSLAATLRSCTREEDTLARLGSDEFILLLSNINSSDDAIVAAKNIITAASLPFKQNGYEIHMTLSIGIAIFPEHGQTREELIRNADTALCNAKTKSRKRHCLYSDKLKNKHSNTVFIENIIRDAIKNNELVIHYQPQIDLCADKIHATEALVRIMLPDGSILLPGKFIEIAEETSLINDIGEIVLNKVCQDLCEWNKKGMQIQVSINISALQLAMGSFAEYVMGILYKYEINPQDVELELTENILVQNMNRTIANIVKLTDAGIKIAIDDFGTGYSSLSYLNHLPLDTLKLDKSFIHKITPEKMEDTIIPAIIHVAKGLKLDFIAEGVETQAQHDYLLQQGSCIAQGFFYSTPLKKEQLFDFVSSYGIKKIG